MSVVRHICLQDNNMVPILGGVPVRQGDHQLNGRVGGVTTPVAIVSGKDTSYSTICHLPVVRYNAPVFSTLLHPSKVSVSRPAEPIRTKKQRRPERSGVYYDNYEIHQAVHPVQVRYQNTYTTVVPELPLGKPMPQPPILLSQQDPSNFETNEAISKTSSKVSNGDVSVFHVVNYVSSQNKDKKRKEVPEDLAEGAKNAKRKCAENLRSSAKGSNNLSYEQQAFVEAAFALSELHKEASSNGSKDEEAAEAASSCSNDASKASSPPDAQTKEEVSSSQRNTAEKSAPPVPAGNLATSASPRSVLQALPPPPFFLPSQNFDLRDTSSI